MGLSRFGVVAMVLAAGVTPMVAQEIASVVVQEAPGLQRRSDAVPTIKTDVRMVTLDVIVTDDKGHTVQGLKESDFRLLEDGSAQRLAGFEAHSRPLKEEPGVKLPANTFSDYSEREESSAMVLMLDALDSPEVRDQMYLRNQMLEYMKMVPEGTRIAIVQLDTRLHLIQGFTSDRQELLDSVMSKRDMPEFSPQHQPCVEDPHASAIAGLPPIGGSLLPDPCTAAPGSQLAELADPYAEQNTDLRRVILRQAVPQLTNYLSGFPGRKNLIWFYSQGAPSEAIGMGVTAMFSDQMSFANEMGRGTHVLTLNQIALTLVNTTMNWAPVPKHFALQDQLRAEGGDFVVNTNGLKEVIEHVEDKAWNYYTLAYTPTNHDFDGKLRRLEVQLEEHGLHLQYRRGYYAINDDAKRAQQMSVPQAVGTAAPVGATGKDGELINTAMGMGAKSPRDVRFIAHVDPAAEVLKAPSAKDGFLAVKYRKDATREYRISYTVETDSLKLTAGGDGNHRGRVDFVCMVYDDEGNVVNSVVSRASVHADGRSYAALVKDGVEVMQTIAVPAKGNFFLRLGVHDVMADKAGALEVSVGEIKLGLPASVALAKP
jgi:VWFA-related protein